MIRSCRVVTLGCAIVCSLLFCSAARAQDASSSKTGARGEARIVDRVDDGRLVELKGNVHPLARSGSDRGPVAADLAMGDLFLVLRRAPETQAAFDRFVASEYDATSPNFHQWLSASEIGERFGPAQADIQTISNWLMSHGLTVDEISKDRMTLRFSGTAAQVQSTLHTEIHKLEANGEGHVANVTNPQIPAALAPVVGGITGLHNFFPKPQHRLGGKVTYDNAVKGWRRARTETPASTAGDAAVSAGRPKPLFGTTDSYGDQIEDVAPYDFATIYNVLPLWQATPAIDGTGQTIAIAGTSNINLADVKAFRTAFGLPTAGAANTPQVVITNGDPGACPDFQADCAGDLVENTLDVEWSGAVAKNAQIKLVISSAPTATSDPLYLSESYIVQNKTATIMNVSYGECELVLGTAGNMQYNTLWQTAASEGIAVFVASGDAGSPACDQGFDQVYGVPYAAQFGLAVSGIASTPYNTAVGGTDFNWGTTAAPYWSTTNSSTTEANALKYIPEVPWNSSCVNPLLLPALQADASYLGISGVTDAESACNFIIENGQTIETNYGVNLLGLVDTIGGGGGVSNCTSGNNGDPDTCSGGYAKPSWQTGVPGIPADSSRDIPDVSFFASDGFLGSSYLICVSGGGSACTFTAGTEPSAQEVGGTSVASPAMAGVMALINQKTGGNQGNPNTVLYNLASAQTYSNCTAETATVGGGCYFNDPDTGTNAMACVSGSTNCITTNPNDPAGILTEFVPGAGYTTSAYAAGTGYDQATGLGSLNVANVVNKWPAANAPGASLSPTSLAFDSTTVGSSSAVKAVTLTNTGKSALTISGITFTGTNPASFTQTNTCGTSVAAGASCTISVTFKPAVAGSLTASLSVADNTYDSPQTVALSGTATAQAPYATFNGTVSISFGSTAVGSTNSTTVTLSNTGTAALSLTSIGTTGTNASSFVATNACGSSLAAGASCVITVTFKPVVAGNLTATLQAVDNSSGSPQTVALSGVATSSALAISISPATLTFASTAVGTTTAAQMVTITNTGTSAITFSTASAISGTNASSFIKSAATCPDPLPAGQSCTNSIEFDPTAAGALSAVLTIYDNAGGPHTVALNGTGAGGGLSVTASPTSLSFAATAVGATSAAQMVTIKNTGTMPLTLNGNTFTGTNASSFIKSATTCVSPLAAGASCTNSIEFTPTVAGSLTGYLNVNTNAPGSPVLVALSGTGGSGGLSVTASPSSLSFAATAVGATSAAQMVTIKNTGTMPLTLTGNTFTGTNASSFIKSATTCVSPLAAGASCTNSIEFTPTVAGSLTGYLNVNTNAPGSPVLVALSGTGGSGGLSVTASPSSLSFAATAVGATSAAQMVTIKNTGTMPLTLTGNTFTGTNASSFIKSATTCVSPLAAGASCTNSIEFTPTVAGSLTGYLNVNTNAPGSPVLVALSGTGGSGGLSVTASPGSLSFAATAVGGTSAAQMVTIKNTGTMPLTLNGNTFTGTNASSFIKSATTCVSPLAAGASCTNSIEFTPTVAGSLTGYLNVNTNAPGSPVLVALSGTGTGTPTISISPGSLSFASTAVGTTTAAQMVTINNTGTTAITFSTASAISGTNASSFIKSAATCPDPLPAGQSCTNSIEFKPAATGALSGTLTIYDNAGGPHIVTLSGTGH